jgi:hypothetical protein
MTGFGDFHRRRQARQPTTNYYDLDSTCHKFFQRMSDRL